VQALTNAITQNRIAPAYLFEGVRGTGKTSSARILAKSLNCQRADGPTPTPCGTCEVCRSIAAGSDLDVTEIDAASNTGVENIRRLVEESHLSAMRTRYRVWIIDEVHKLSSAAMNALLKTLEEPPQRVVFILATTESEKVLPTIISRCQRYRFGQIGLEPMADHLSWIAGQEGIEMDSAAIGRIAQASGGGLRDAESLLDQVSLLPAPVTVAQIDWLTGAVPEQALLEMVSGMIAPDPMLDPNLTVSLVEQVQRLIGQSKAPMAVLEGLTRMVQLVMQARYAGDPPSLTPVTLDTWETLKILTLLADIQTLRQVNAMLRAAEPQIRQAHSPRLWLESLMLEVAGLMSQQAEGCCSTTT
jgi:DNA polymerase-3 subunit gamma/tau